MSKNTKQFGFILGRDRALSVAEIFAVYKFKQEYKIVLNNKDCLILETDWKPEIKHLGGTIKIFEVQNTTLDLNEMSKISGLIDLEDTKSRINFGVSGYGVGLKQIKEIGFKIKERIEDTEQKARFVTSKFADLSSVIVTENKLLSRGFELIIVKNGNQFVLGKTLEVQDYKSYSKRDFGRPARDDKSGMLPPKLAQILINLGEKGIDEKIYDPFCGSGTVLQEAILMGYKNIFGSDISEKATADTKENLEWLDKNIKADIFVSDIINPSKKIEADLIVGEGFLGEPHRRNKDKAITDALELSDFYAKAFANIKEFLTHKGRAVIAIPFFIVGREYIYLPVLEKIEELGLKIIKPEIGIKLPGRGNLTYHRSDSFVGREIIIVEK